MSSSADGNHYHQHFHSLSTGRFTDIQSILFLGVILRPMNEVAARIASRKTISM